MRIRPLDHELDPAACDAIVAGLPGWFGDDRGIRDCAAAVKMQPGFVAVDEGVAGFLTWEPRDQDADEITWMAVRAGREAAGRGPIARGRAGG